MENDANEPLSLAMMAGRGEAMPFFGRLSNTISFALMDFFIDMFVPRMEEIIKQRIPDLPPLNVRNAHLATGHNRFSESPRKQLARVSQFRTACRLSQDYVGKNHRYWRNNGRCRAPTAQPGDSKNEKKIYVKCPKLQTWSDILDLRPQTILLSFGTVAKSFAMPEDYKATIRETFKKFPNVTFIWKYEVLTSR